MASNFSALNAACTRTSRLALEEKGVDYTLETVEIFGPGGVPKEHRLRHPFGRIPVLEHGSFLLYETLAITRYIDEAFEGPPLQSATAAGRAHMQQITGVLDAYAYRPMVWGVFVGSVLTFREGGTPDKDAVADALAGSAVCLGALERLAASGDWLVDGRLSLADLHAFPMLRCLSLAKEGRSLLARHETLQRWFDPMLLRGSVRRTRTEHEPES